MSVMPPETAPFLMIYVPLIAYLKTGQLGPLAQRSPRSCVLETLGPPPYWSGWGGVPCEQATIWVYDSVQFNFDDDFRILDTHIEFDRKFANGSVTYSDWDNQFVKIVDLDINAICTPDLFVESMNRNGIVTSHNMLSGGRLMIDTEAGVQARFGLITDWGCSMETQKPVQTDRTYLHRITTVKLA